MNCYFYSKQKGLIGLINYRFVQNSLVWDKNELIAELSGVDIAAREAAQKAQKAARAE